MHRCSLVSIVLTTILVSIDSNRHLLPWQGYTLSIVIMNIPNISVILFTSKSADKEYSKAASTINIVNLATYNSALCMLVHLGYTRNTFSYIVLVSIAVTVITYLVSAHMFSKTEPNHVSDS